MNTATDLALVVDDLAGRWTERALEILEAAGMGHVSVDKEIKIWQALRFRLTNGARGRR